MTKSILAGLILTVSAPLALQNSAEAQLSSIIKKKVTEAIKKPAEPEKTAPAQNSSGSFNEDVLEITPAVFDAVIRGLNAELKLQNEFRQVLAKYPTQEEYQACQGRSAQSPEGAKIGSELMNMPEGMSAEEARKRITSVATRMDSLMKKQCPYDPSVWSPYNRKQKLDSIHVQAAEAAGMTASRSSIPMALLTERQYSVLGERIERGCQFIGEPAGIGATATITDTLRNPRDSLPTPSSGGGVKIPGIGNNIFWVYTSGEMNVLTRANCRRYAALNKLLMK